MRSDEKSERRVGVLRRHAHEVRNYKVRMKILTTLLVMLTVLLIIIYFAALLYERTGSFTVSLSKFENQRYGLSLYDHKDKVPGAGVTQLNAEIAEDITNIYGNRDLPENLDSIDGTHNGENYIAYTFYLKNAGTVDTAYDYTLTVSNISNDLDEAIRIRIYKDGVPTTYAKVGRDGNPEVDGIPDSDEGEVTTPFYSQNWVAHERVEDFLVGEVTRFTVVIWIEGPDPDCIDYLIGGELRLDMTMEVVH